MATPSLCSKLFSGFDSSCDIPSRKYFQQAVLINKLDIETFTVTTPAKVPTPTCEYKVTFNLLSTKTGYLFIGPEAGSSFLGYFDKTRSDLGHPSYIHNAQILITGASEEQKCTLDSLDQGSFVAAYQLKDGTVEIYGIRNGLSTGDYSYNLQEGGGGTAILVSSLEDAPENEIPLVYEAAVPGQEGADFDSLFANP
mgnify:CR=1 FL=1|tara:strand:+ start:15798 stop:16388 length:591 start_codon:yes stop_codon:yes gene_type:complete